MIMLFENNMCQLDTVNMFTGLSLVPVNIWFNKYDVTVDILSQHVIISCKQHD